MPHGFVSVHIRTGFKNSFTGEIIVFSKEFYAGNTFARSQDSWHRMIECALDIAGSKFGRNSTIFIASDDQEPKSWAAAEYKSRTNMTLHAGSANSTCLQSFIVGHRLVCEFRESNSKKNNCGA